MKCMTRVFCFLAAILSLSVPAGAAGRNDLVVMLGYRAAGDPHNVVVGAGILVHQDANRAIIVTAEHNLPERDPASPLFRDEKIFVEFFSAGGRDVQAKVVAEAVDSDLDLAVLEVRNLSVPTQLFEAARHVLVPDGAEVVMEHGAFAVGNPNRRPWFQNHAPEPILEKVVKDGRESIRFESSVADVGMSGGALFSEHGPLLGMVQRIAGSEGGTRALGIGTIVRQLEKWNVPFSLAENPEVYRFASRRILADLGLASAAGLRKTLEKETPDFGRLHLFWMAGLEPVEVESALGGLVDGKRDSFASLIFDRLGKTENCIVPGRDPSRLAKAEQDLVLAGLMKLSKSIRLKAGKTDTCASHMRLWIRGLVRSGLDPDLVVPNSYYSREALLAIAMRSKNRPAALALLGAGASPHPYQDLSGTEYDDTRVLAPLRFVLRDFVGSEQDELRDALISSGLVVSRSIRNPYHNHHLASEALQGLPVTPDLAEAEMDPICERAGERYGFDWCGYLRNLASTVRFYTGTQDCDSSGNCPAEITHTLFVGRHRALLLAERGTVRMLQTVQEESKPVVVEVTRDSGQWYAWERGRNYGCIPRADGFEPSTCWRRYSAGPGTFRQPEAKAEKEQPKTSAPKTSLPKTLAPHTFLDGIKVEGISLSTPLSKALASLEKAGYTTQTVAGPGNYENTLTTRDYTLRTGDQTRQLKVIAMNEGIRALSFRAYGAGDYDIGFDPPGGGDAKFLFYETDRWRDGSELMVVEAGGSTKSFLRHRNWPTQHSSVEIDLLRRFVDEAAPEKAFFERWLAEWLGRVAVQASSQGPCIDRHAHLRGPKGNGCLTPGERATSYLAQVKTGRNIHQLPGGLSYEVLVEGEGPSPSEDSSIIAYLVFRYLDGARKDDRINHWRKVVREIQWPEIKEAILEMKVGAKWRIYVPPGVGNNDSRYLQLAEIQLTRISGD